MRCCILRKFILKAAVTAFTFGSASVTFAANSFSDVQPTHWAYKAVTELAEVGVIEGYGDYNDDVSLSNKFNGGRNITRYEMAQMIAKALARVEGETSPFNVHLVGHQWRYTDDVGRDHVVDGAVKAFNMGAGSITLDELNKLRDLVYEFQGELETLGVRVDDLRDHSDKVQWAGKIEYTYNYHKYRGNTGIKQNSDGTYGPYRGLSDRNNHDGVFRLEPVAEIGSHWKAVARFDAGFSLKKDSTNDVFLKRVYAEGYYDKFNVKLGRFGFCPAVEDGIVADTNMSGIQLAFGSKWKAVVSYGRVGGGDEPEYATHFDSYSTYDGSLGTYRHISRNGGTSDDPTDVVALNVLYQPGEQGLYGGASYYYAKDKDFRAYSKNFDGDKASIWAVSLGYRFNDMLDLHGSYGRNGKADFQKDGWAVDLRYGNYGDYAERGDWAVWAGYAKFGDGAGIVSNQGDDIATGEKGWHVGAAYAPFKNVGLLVRYADAKILDTNVKDRHFFGRVEFFF